MKKKADLTNSLSKPGPEVIKLFSCSTQLSMKFFLLINVKMPTIVGILTFMSRKNCILSLSEPEKCWISWYFHTYEHLKFHAQLSWARKKFYNLGARSDTQPKHTIVHPLLSMPYHTGITFSCLRYFLKNQFSNQSLLQVTGKNETIIYSSI